MEEELSIILNLAEGINLNQNNDQVVVQATLGGNVMESDLVIPGHSTLFDCNLVWQCSSKVIKRMKMENFPIKLEVFSVHGDERQLIGHLIVPLRAIPRLPMSKALTVKPKWYKVIGLAPAWRSQRPELLMSVMITDNGYFEKTKKSLETGGGKDVALNSKLDILTSQQGLFIRLLREEGLLQVGNIDTECDVYLVKITLRNILNLSNMLENRALEADKLVLSYTFPPNAQPFVCELTSRGQDFSLHEIIALKIRTSLKCLKKYFELVFHIPIEVSYEGSLVATSHLHLKNMQIPNDLSDFLDVCRDNDSNVYEAESTCDVNPIQEVEIFMDKPVIEFSLSIQYITTKRLAIEEVSERKRQVEQGAGDHPPTTSMNFTSLEDDEFDSKSEEEDEKKELSLAISAPEIISIDPKPEEAELEEEEKAPPFKEEPKPSVKFREELERLHTFVYVLVVKSIKFPNQTIENGIWQVSFYHARANTPFTILNVELHNVSEGAIEFGNLELKLYFSSTPESINGVICSDTAIFNVCGPYGTRGKAELNNQSLLAAIKEDKTGIIMLEGTSGENVAMATVFITLTDLGVNHNSLQRKTIVEPRASVRPYVDDGLAYKFVEDLEKWKIEQEEDFLVELKRKEIQHLARLSTEWKRKKAKYEKDLSERLAKCSILTSSLEEAQAALKDKGIEQIKQEQESYKQRVELEQCFKKKVLGIEEKSRRLEADLTQKLHEEHLKHRETEIVKANLERENKILRERIKNLELSTKEMRESVFPKEQVVSLLQDLKILNEKYEASQRSKMFYKQEWAKMIREVHIIRSESVEKQKKTLAERRALNFGDWLDSETFELTSNVSELEFIKRSFDCEL